VADFGLYVKRDILDTDIDIDIQASVTAVKRSSLIGLKCVKVMEKRSVDGMSYLNRRSLTHICGGGCGNITTTAANHLLR